MNNSHIGKKRARQRNRESTEAINSALPMWKDIYLRPMFLLHTEVTTPLFPLANVGTRVSVPVLHQFLPGDMCCRLLVTYLRPQYMLC